MAPPFSKEIKERAKADHDFRCANCNSAKKLEVHHIIPESIGGLNQRVNAIPLCHNCHIRADLLAFRGVTIYGRLNELPDTLFREGVNPFKNIELDGRDKHDILTKTFKGNRRKKKK
jgi:hypothetical protein